MHYYFAMHYARTGERDKQIERLENAFKFMPGNPDFLIATHIGKEDKIRVTDWGYGY